MTNKKYPALFAMMLFFSLFITPLTAQAQSAGAACTAAQEGKSACHLNGCFKCESLVWKAQPLIHGATSDACSSSTAGLLQWTGTDAKFCNGTSWTSLSSGSAGPTSFAFTNQEGKDPSTLLSSNEVTLLGFTGTATATCGAGCSSISKNGTWIGATATGFYAGDKIAIRQTSSASANTTTTASVTVGSMTSNDWRVTTGYVNAFSFTNQTGVALNSTISSNAVTLGGNFTNWTAVCGTNCTAIAKDGVWGSTSVAGFNPGNTIAIRLTSANSISTAKTTTVAVGPSTSDTWSVTTTSDACAGSPTVGTVCNDGTVYVGLSPDGNVKMYTTPCDYGSVSCGAGSMVTYGDVGVYYSVTSTTQGEANTTTLAGYANTTAAQACNNLVAGGKSDWYLPARDEWLVVYNAKSYLSGFFAQYYWTSTEYSGDTAYVRAMDDGRESNQYKSWTNYFRCVRKD